MVSQSTNIRQSNAELLRIIVMLMIVMHHFAVHALYPDTILNNNSILATSIDGVCIAFFHCFFLIGVNVFIIISGFFGLKCSFKGFFKLYLIMFFYNFVYYGLKTYVHYDELLFSDIISFIINIVFPFGHNRLWFMSSYIVLYFMAPLLNTAIKSFDKKSFIYVIILLTITNVYLGNIKLIENTTGHNVLNFIYLYIIGAFIKQCKFERYRKFNVMIYCLSSIMWGG